MRAHSGFFWPSYADLLTALFVVMMVLFVLSFRLFREREDRLKMLATSYQKIEELELALHRLDDSPYFQFQPLNQRYELMVPIQFEQWGYEIPTKYTKNLVEAGQQLQALIEAADSTSLAYDLDVKYLVIIEGMAARDPKNTLINNDRQFIQQTYLLSYQRALALAKLWRAHGITFAKDNFELIIAGSGIYGSGRYAGSGQEGKNRRFLIQIIPKTGQIQKREHEELDD